MTRIFSAAFAALVFSSSMVAAQTSTATALGPISTLDCYDTLGSIDDEGVDGTFQSSGKCQETCAAKGAKVMVTSSGSTCYCGDTLPPNTAKVSKSNCNTDCSGYDLEKCGGVGFYQFYLTGLGAPKIDSGSSSSSASSSASSATSATSAANTVVVTQPPTESPESSSGGSSKVGIAVGVVVGIVGVAAIAGVGAFLIKRRRRQQLEDEHRRSAAINGFVGGPKSETSSANDSRLDPSIYSHQRQSIGSIADERDFSRRILQVRNPDRESRASHV